MAENRIAAIDPRNLFIVCTWTMDNAEAIFYLNIRIYG